jgi:hypothetical protein
MWNNTKSMSLAAFWNLGRLRTGDCYAIVSRFPPSSRPLRRFDLSTPKHLRSYLLSGMYPGRPFDAAPRDHRPRHTGSTEADTAQYVFRRYTAGGGYCAGVADGSAFTVLKSLVFFDDAEDDPMPNMLKPFDWTEAKRRITDAVLDVSANL